MKVFGERDDVDLLATELVDHLTDASTSCAHTGSNRIDVGVVGPHSDLGAVSGLTGTRLDLDDAIGNLGDLKLKQALDEPGVGSAHNDLRALWRAAHLDDVGLQPHAGVGALVGNLL